MKGPIPEQSGSKISNEKEIFEKGEERLRTKPDPRLVTIIEHWAEA